jgi:hypothetical protein
LLLLLFLFNVAKLREEVVCSLVGCNLLRCCCGFV